MGFYGNLYTNLTTFFHNFTMKGTTDLATNFPEDKNILKNTRIKAQPEVVYDTFSVNAGNRWIQFVPGVSELKNPDGTNNYNGVTIYHALPSGVSVNEAEEITEDINFLDAVEEDIAASATSVSNGGYLKVQTSVYDEAGHLKSSTSKYLKFPNVNEIESIAKSAKSTAEQVEQKFTGVQNEVSQMQQTINTFETQLTTANSLASNANKQSNDAISIANDAIKASNEAKSVASNAFSQINKAEASANSAQTSADQAQTSAAAANYTMRKVVNAIEGEEGYQYWIKELVSACLTLNSSVNHKNTDTQVTVSNALTNISNGIDAIIIGETEQ